MRSLFSYALGLSVATLLAACSAQQPVPANHYYRLADSSTPPRTPVPLLRGTVAVNRLQADGVRGSRAMLYSDDKAPLALQQYHYHHWLDAPPRLIQEHMVSYLRAGAVTGQVLSFRPGLRPDFTINGKLQRFEEIRSQDKSKSKIVLGLELELVAGETGPVLLVQEYRRERAIAGASVHDTAAGFGAALDEIYRAFLDDLRQLPPRSP